MPFSSIEEAIEEIRQGKCLLVLDDEDRENEGDIIAAAETITPEIINFMAKYGRGLVCLPATGERLDELGLEQMVRDNSARLSTAFTVSIDARDGTTTGISASDRANTVKAFVNPDAKPEDLLRPGHVFPLRAEEGGVLRRSGHTEAVVDLARMAGFSEAGVLCEIMNEDGTMSRLPELIEFSKKHNLKMITIKDLIAYRMRNEHLVEEVLQVKFPTAYGEFQLHLFKDNVSGDHNIALKIGEIKPEDPCLVRVHSSCLTGDILGSIRCDCGFQLHEALKRVAEAGSGVVLYMMQEGRGIGLVNKLKAYALQDEGYDTVEANEHLGFPADLRDYGIGAQILVALGVKKMRLLTNNPRKLIGLEGYGLEIVERTPIEVGVNDNNIKYLSTKKEKLGHLLSSI